MSNEIQNSVCVKCGTTNPATSLFCSKCGNEINRARDISDEELKDTQSIPVSPVSSAPPVKKNNTLLIILVVLALIYGCWSWLPKNDGGVKDRGTMASIQCRDFLQDTLKSPSSAVFPMSTAKNTGNETYILYSYVDAENAFGAKLRKNFYCKIRYLGGDDGYRSSWEVIDLDLDD